MVSLELTVVVTFVPGPGNKSFDNGTSLNSGGKSLVSTSTMSVLYGTTFFVRSLLFEKLYVRCVVDDGDVSNTGSES